MFLLTVFLLFTPWVQTAVGDGVVTTFHPSDRPQNITAPVKGRIKQWHVHEGSTVQKGDFLLEIVDNDHNYVERLELELKAAQQKADVTQAAAETAKIDYERRQSMFDQGLASRHELEKSKINYNEYLSKQAAAVAELAKVQTSRSRQDSQLIKAPADGTIVQIRSGDSATFIKEGDVVASFIPSKTIPAVELYIKGVDVPLVKPGAKVRLQFEGWPAVQFSGWPSISVGSFGGIVQTGDLSVSANGKFRVLIVQDPAEKWPNQNFLRFGARARGWILLNTVSVGYEWWRQLNSFPPLPPKGTENNYMQLQTYSKDETDKEGKTDED
ncbi:MAG: HlyD family efflux transporter periplasmic adaptor subunit [Alphaproteobacteria bacterium]|nr:HlyD family efflux transporter periplasmic adaptor subunit [Alphaproteobacteria bacterium]